MKAVFFIALVFLLAIATAEVLVLNESNFDSAIQAKEYTLVKYFAPWCGHCKSLKEPYIAASTKVGDKAQLAEIDCTTEDAKALCEKAGVRGYPTLKLHGKDGSVTEYEEGRTTDAIVNFMLAQTTPAVTFITSKAEYDAFIAQSGDLKLIVNSAKDGAAAVAVESVAKTLRKTASIAVNTQVTDGKITLYRTFDEPQVVFEGEVTGAALTAFVNDNSLPIIGEIGPHNYKKYVDRNLPLVWIFIDTEDAAQVAAVDAIKPVAKKFAKNAVYATLDGKKWASHAKSFGLENSTPGLVIEDRTSRKKFAYPAAELTVADFEAFMSGFVAKTLKPIFRSKPAPAEAVTNGLTTVVGTTYKDLVYNNDKDVFIAMTAEWCGHCKKFAAPLAEVAEHFAKDENIVIAFIDAAENDLDETQFEVTGFPTIMFFQSGAKDNVMRFNGDRTKEAVIEFINKNRKSTPATGRDEL